MLSSFLIGLVLAATSQAASTTEIPARFHGAWSTDLYHCDDRESGLNLSISATALTYFEAADTVIAVTSAESDGIHIVADYEDYEGGERVWRTMILSDDLQKLTFTYGDGPDGVYLRCPTAFEIGEPDPDPDPEIPTAGKPSR